MNYALVELVILGGSEAKTASIISLQIPIDSGLRSQGRVASASGYGWNRDQE